MDGLLQKAEEARTPVQTGPSAGEEQDEPEELDFMFDEEMEQIDGRRNTFTDWSDEDSDCEIDDRDVNKILIVTQTPPYLRKHPGGDRTGNHTSRSKLTSELVKVINDGLYYYEQDLWDDTYEPEYATIKVSWSSGLWLFAVDACQDCPLVQNQKIHSLIEINIWFDCFLFFFPIR